jgi:hypothetical protein
MGSECWYHNAFGGTGKRWTIAAVSLIVTLTAVTTRAGDIVTQPADNLTVINSVINLSPQVPAAALASPEAAPPPPGAEQGWVGGLHILRTAARPLARGRTRLR